MNRNELIDKLKTKFSIKELVCNHCYTAFGDRAWLFLSTELLSILYTLRFVIFNRPIIINNWHKGGLFSQRGFRCNMCKLVLQKENIYVSSHMLGKGIDFNVQGLTANQVSTEIKNNIEKFQYPIRLEKDTNGWTHVDVYQPYGSDAKLVEFNG